MGKDGNDTIHGLYGDDKIIGGDGADTLYGGSGDDTAVFDGLIEDYDIYVNSGKLTVAANDGSGTDTLTSIEHLEFCDDDEDSYSVTVSGGTVNITPDAGSG